MKLNRTSWGIVISLCLVVAAAFAPAGIACADSGTGSLSGTFTVADTQPPAAVRLSVTARSDTYVTLSWVAPGDNSGAAAQYDIRYADSPIVNEVEWQAATKVANPPSPKASGATESFIVNELNPGKYYYFSIKAADNVPNWLALSNSVRGTTLQYGEEIAASLESYTLAETIIIDQDYSVESRVAGGLNKASTLTSLNQNSPIDVISEAPGNMESSTGDAIIKFNISTPRPGINWRIFNIGIYSALAAGLFILYIVTRRFRRTSHTLNS